MYVCVKSDFSIQYHSISILLFKSLANAIFSKGCVCVCLNKSHIINTFLLSAKAAVPVVEAMNAKWKLCDTFIVGNVKRAVTTMMMRRKWRRSRAARKSARKKSEHKWKCFHIVRIQRKGARNGYFDSYDFIIFFRFIFGLYICNQLLFLPQAKVTVVIKQLFSRRPPKRERRKNVGFELGLLFVWSKIQTGKNKHSQIWSND